ncbi:MAG: LolA family protein [Bacteroidales bacterium]
MKKIIYILSGFILFFNLNAQGFEDPAELAQSVAEKMQIVERYTADVLIQVDVEFINIEDKKAKVFFEKPDKFEIKAKGIALLPKQGAEMEYLELLNSDFTAIDEKREEVDGIDTRLIKIIPMGAETDIVLAQLWIDEDNLRIERMQTYTKSSGSYKIDFSYADHPYDLPSTIRVEFDVKDMSLPASMTGDLESLSKKIEKRGVSKGTVVLEYSNYEVNY